MTFASWAWMLSDFATHGECCDCWLKTKLLAIGLKDSEQVANPRLLSLQVNPYDRGAD